MQAEVFDEVFRQMWKDYRSLVKPALLMAATWVAFGFAYHILAFNPFLQATGWPIRFGTEDERRFRDALHSVLRPQGLPLIAIQLCFYLFFHLALINTCRQVRTGKPDIRKALGDAARRWPHYFATVTLLLLVFFGVTGGGVYAANALAPPPPGYVPSLFNPHFTPVHGAILAAGIVVALYVGIRWNLFPFAIAEGAGPLASLSKSWKATKGQWWSTFLALGPLAILLGMIVAAVSLVVSLPLTAPAGLTPLFGLPTGQFAPGAYPASLAWNQGATLALNTLLFVFLFDVPFVYGHTVVWQITQEQYRPSRPTASYARKYATGPKPAARLASTSKYLTQNPSEDIPVTAWRPPPRE